MMQPTKILHILGRCSALEAIDQQGDYCDLQDALDSYWINVGDTLAELMPEHGEADVRIVEAGFVSVLTEKNIEWRQG